MNVETLLKPSDPIRLPAFVICASNAFKKKCRGTDCEKNQSTARFLFDSSFDFEDLFTAAHMFTPAGQFFRFNQSSLIDLKQKVVTKYRLGQQICFHVNFTMLYEPQVGFKRADIRKKMIPIAFGVTFNDELILSREININIFLVPVNGFAFRLAGNAFHPNLKHWLILGFKRTDTRLLPAPYATDCRNYVKDKTQDFCLRNCLFAEVFNSRQQTPTNLAYFEPDDVLYEMRTMEKATESSDSKCDAKCSKLDCQSTQYEGLEVVNRRDENNLTKVSMMVSSEADVIITYRPKMSLVEYFAFVGSILGLFLGFSIFGVGRIGGAFVQKFYIERKDSYIAIFEKHKKGTRVQQS